MITNSLKSKSDYSQKDVHVKFHNLRAVRSAKDANSARADVNESSRIEAFKVKRLLANQVLAAQHDSVFARLLPHLEPVSLSGGEDLYKPGDPVRFIYFPEDVVVSQFHVLEDGRATEFAMTGNEGVVGLSAIFEAQPQPHWTQVIVGGNALKIKVENIRQEFNNGGSLQASLFSFLNSYLAQLAQRVVCNAHHMAEERFCSWLLMLDDRNKTQGLLLTQDQIAHYLGVQRPSVSQIAKAFRERDIINYKRGHFSILDRQRLESSACECYSMIKVNPLAKSAAA